MKIILMILGAIAGYYIADYIQSDFPLLAAILGNEGSPAWLGKYSMPSGMLPTVGIIVGAIAGSSLGESLSSKK